MGVFDTVRGMGMIQQLAASWVWGNLLRLVRSPKWCSKGVKSAKNSRRSYGLKNKAVPRNTKKQSYIIVVLLIFLSGLLYFSKPLSCSRSPPFVQWKHRSQNIAWSRGSELWFVSHQAIPRPKNRLCFAISTHLKKIVTGNHDRYFSRKNTYSKTPARKANSISQGNHLNIGNYIPISCLVLVSYPFFCWLHHHLSPISLAALNVHLAYILSNPRCCFVPDFSWLNLRISHVC